MEKLLVSVVIPTFNRKLLLKKALASLRNLDFPRKEMETIVVDNGSTDGTCQMVKKEFPYVKLVAFKQNEGIPAALNAAIEKSKGRYIFQTNDDVIFERSCLAQLINNCLGDKKVGIAGGRLYFADRPQTPMISNLNLNLYIGYHSLRKTPSDRVCEVDIVTGACMLISRKLIEAIGSFDESFGPYGGEDYEFCFRAKRAGYKVIFCPKAAVWVKEFKTEDKLTEKRRLFDHYKGKFRFMLLYASPLQNLTFFPIQLFFAPIFCYTQSGKKITAPMFWALFWNLKNLKRTAATRYARFKNNGKII